MPHGKTRFNKLWLQDTDESGTLIGKWCSSGKDEYHYKCTKCQVDLSCANNGKSALIQHAKSDGHKNSMKDTKKQCTINFEKSSPGQDTQCSSEQKNQPTSSQSSSSSLSYSFPNEQSLKAEIIWCLRVAYLNQSYRSCNGLVDTLVAMFPDSEIAKKMSLEKKKSSYMISDGLGPALLNQSQHKAPYYPHGG